MPEYLDLYNKQKKPIGQTIVRGEPVPSHTYRLVVSILTVNSRGELLMTKRAPEKTYAGCWEITGGSVQAGETSRQGAVRELREETGIAAAEEELTYCGDYFGTDYFFEYYLLRKDVPLSEVKLQAGETVEARWVTVDELYALHAAGQTVSHQFRVYTEKYAAVLAACVDKRKNI